MNASAEREHAAPAGAGREPAEPDFARLEIETPFDARWLRDFLSDPERILRLNPFMEFSRFESVSPDRWHIAGRNLALERDFDAVFRHEPLPDGGFRLHWEGLLKTCTEVRIVEEPDGTAKLVVTDDYSGTPEEERRQRMDEVDTSFMPWGQAVWRYLRNWKRWSWLPGWKWYMGRYWLHMKPAARRISFILLVLFAMETVLVLFVLLILWLELDRFMN